MHFYQQVLSYFLNKHHVVQIQSRKIVSLLFIVYYLQLSTLILDVNPKDQQAPTLINLLNLFYYASEITRPYKFLLNYEGFRLYCFLLPTFLLLIQLIGLIIDQFVQEIIQKIIKLSKQQRKDFQSYETEKLLSVLFQTHLYVISLYSIDLFIITILEAYNTNLFIMVISLLLLITELAFVFLNVICSESIHFNSSPLHVSQPSKLYSFNFILIVCSIFLAHYDFNWNRVARHMTRHIINFLIYSIYIYFEIKKRSSLLQKSSLMILSLGFSYNFISLILQDEYQPYQIGVVFILCPFLLNILMNIQESQNQINFTKNRSIEQVYNNLLLIEQSNSKQKIHQLDILIMLRMKSDYSDPFNSEFLLFNSKIVKSKNEEKPHWYLKYIAIKIAFMQCAEALSLIYHFKQQLLYSDFSKQYLKISFSVSFIQTLQLEKIKFEVYEKLYQNITKNYDYLARLTSNFIEYKIQITRIQRDILAVFIQKEKLYQLLLESKLLKKNEIFQMNEELIKEALAIQESLTLQLKYNKTYRVQQLLILLHVEFFNNIIQAELLKNYQLHNEEMKQNYLENMEFLGMRMNDEVNDISLFEVSQDFLNALGYKKIQKSLNEIAFKNFFPNEFYADHKILVHNFLQTGKNKLIEKTQDIIVRGNENIYYYTIFQLTISPNDENGLKFYGFIKILEDQPKALFINQQKQIVGITSSFMQLLQSLNINIALKKLIYSDATKLIKNYGLLPFNKYVNINFINNPQEFTVMLREKLSIIELQLIEGLELLINDESSQNFQVLSEHILLEPNDESEVVVPKSQSFEEIQSPKSSLRRERTSQQFLRSDTKQFLTLKSKAESKKQSEPVPQQQVVQHSKASANDKQNNFGNDQASSKFSRGFLDHSIYYQKYALLDRFVSRINKKTIYLFLSFLLLGLFINFMFQVISLVSFVPRYQKVNQDADSSSVKSNFITPIHNCVTSQLGALSYLMLLALKKISLDTFNERILFCQASVIQSYDFLKDSFITQLSNENLENFFDDHSIEMTQIEGLTLVNRNISLKNALYYYYEAQYFIIYSNINNSSFNSKVNLKSYISNEFVYYQSNILNLDNYFDNLSLLVSESTINRSIQLEKDYAAFFLKMIFLQLLCFFLALSFLIKIYFTYSDYFYIFANLNILSTKKELQSINKIKTLLTQDNAYSEYSFDLNSYEKEIQSSLFYYTLKINQQRIAGMDYSPPILWMVIMISLIGSIFVIPISVLQALNQDFIMKYQNSCLLLQQLSQMSSAVTAIYELKETSYLINQQSSYFYFFSDEKRDEYNMKIESELEKIQSFLYFIPQLDYNTLLIGNQFEALIVQMNKNSLCNYLVHYSQQLAQVHCDTIYSGVMNLGLYSTISEIYKQVSEEYQNTLGFQARYRSTAAAFEEVEIGLITSDAIFYIQIALYNDIIAITEEMVSIHKIINYTYIFCSIVFTGIFLHWLFPYFSLQQTIIRYMIFLVPKHQFYLDQKFETDFRLLVIKQN